MDGKNHNAPPLTDGSIDAGLFVLSLLFPDGCPYSHEQIAFICGCSRSNIWIYEKNGLKKLRAALIMRGIDHENFEGLLI